MKDRRAVTRCGSTNQAQTVTIYFAGKEIFCACCGEDGSEEDSYLVKNHVFSQRF
jgi:hypothetical protein